MPQENKRAKNWLAVAEGVTSLKVLQPRQLPQAPSLDADGLLRLVKEQQIGAVLLGGSALFRTNGLTQFGARHLVSRVGGDPFSNIGEAEESMQLPIALWYVQDKTRR
ncbi:hypothetical protein WJX77_011242 [Trebouxia sp. C0004]